MRNDLDRFVKAQGFTFELALNELKTGLKRSHWMWFIFPQLYGLGFSEMSKRYGILNLEEAKAYLNHPILGQRLNNITRIVIDSEIDAKKLFSEIDYQKFISCMTLFMTAAPEPELSIFAVALQKISTIDKKTIELLEINNDNV